jgi:hypothetical protein
MSKPVNHNDASYSNNSFDAALQRQSRRSGFTPVQASKDALHKDDQSRNMLWDNIMIYNQGVEDSSSPDPAPLPLFGAPGDSQGIDTGPSPAESDIQGIDATNPAFESQPQSLWPELDRFLQDKGHELTREGEELEEDIDAMFIQSSPEEINHYQYMLASFSNAGALV